MKITVAILFLLLFYVVFFMFPLKIKIYKKIKRIVSNDEMFEMGKNGDKDVIKLKKMTNVFLLIGFIFAIVFVVEKYKLIEF